jgi:hypothetical protein
MHRSILFPFAFASAVTLSACGGGDGGTGLDDDGGNGGSGGTTREIVADPSFSGVVQEIFNRKGCAAGSCHGSSAQAGLVLTTGSSYGNLVGVQATQAAVSRVIPGNANDSYLVVKVEGRQTFGEKMPIGGSALDNIDLSNLKNWINQGAKNN